MILNHSSDAIGHLGFGAILGFIGVSYIVYCLGVGLYNITLHPLAKLPGPKFRHAFHIAKFWDIWTGYNVHTSKELHDKYGPTVRISPDNISFNNEEAWAAIYGSRQGKKQIPKNTDFYLADKREKVVSIISAGDVDHSRMRRALSHAFSDAAVREQEPILNSYFDLLIQKLHEKIGGPSKGEVNLVRWYNFTTFDIIGDLSFQESFEALRTEEYNSWIANIFKGIKFARIFAILNAYPLVGTPLLSFLALFPQLQGAKKRHEQYTVEKAARRLEAEMNRNDFMSYILRHNDEKGLSKPEILNMANLLIIAGSETTATLLSGATFHLLKHPAAMEKLVAEIRTSFPDPAEMTFASLSKLKYLHACIQEGFRMYPPVPILLPRKTVQSTVINGYFIPENTSVGVHQWSAYHSEANFSRSEEYIPERWLDDPRFVNDKRGVLQPFSFGSRNCIGQHLALVEMKAILARVLWHFDLSLREDSDNWAEQKVFFLWDKGDLNVKLSVRK